LELDDIPSAAAAVAAAAGHGAAEDNETSPHTVVGPAALRGMTAMTTNGLAEEPSGAAAAAGVASEALPRELSGEYPASPSTATAGSGGGSAARRMSGGGQGGGRGGQRGGRGAAAGPGRGKPGRPKGSGNKDPTKPKQNKVRVMLLFQ
jgi:hypothetical protein